ncbi:MAG: hypothetical protein WEB90_00295 [Gemmatimonadota bacterium]
MSAVQDPEYEILRALTPAAKLAAMQSLIRQAYDLKAAWVRAQSPHLPEAEVWAKASELVAGGRS